MPAIKHRPDCDRPTGPTGTEAACNCATYQGQFPPPEGYEEPVPSRRDREVARVCSGHTYACTCDQCRVAEQCVARHREELLAPLREALAAHDGNAPPSAYETLDRIREVIGDG